MCPMRQTVKYYKYTSVVFTLQASTLNNCSLCLLDYLGEKTTLLPLYPPLPPSAHLFTVHVLEFEGNNPPKGVSSSDRGNIRPVV